MDKNSFDPQSQNMRETSSGSAVSFWQKLAWQATLLTIIVTILMCFKAIQIARSEIEDGAVSISSVGILTLIADFDFDSKTITGDVTPTRRGKTVTINKPEVPWLKAATIALFFAILANLHLLYLIALRKESAKKKSKDAAFFVAFAGILSFAASEMNSDASNLAIGILTYAAVIHFACNVWPLLRSQLYKG
jgi:hypothetical protein